MELSVVYRSYSGGNRKERPPFYSKRRALLSLLRAAEPIRCRILFLNDGPAPDDCVDLMEGAGEIVTLPSVGMRRSFLAGLRLPVERGWPADDVVYFCEDDYLHTEDALVRLREAARVVPSEYFALYGSDQDVAQQDPEARPGETTLPPGWDPGAPVEIDGVRWARVPASTSTFAARVGALRYDHGVFRQAGWPHRTMYRDRDMCLTYQGYAAHRWRDLGQDLALGSPGSGRARVREAALVPFRAGMNVRALLRRRRHTLVAALPNLATHLESAYLSEDRDWAQIAAAVDLWAGPAASPPVRTGPEVGPEIVERD